MEKMADTPRIRAAIARRYGKTSTMCKAIGMNPQVASALTTGRFSPLSAAGVWSEQAELFAAAIGENEADVWPGYADLMDDTVLYLEEADWMPKHERDMFFHLDTQRLSDYALQKVRTERHFRVLIMRFMLGCTLTEAAKYFGVGKERARQIEHKALMQAKHPTGGIGYLHREASDLLGG